MKDLIQNTGQASIKGGLFTWRTLRRALIAFACFATLIALSYTVEDWRGKRAWEKCKLDLEAQGYDFNWKNLIPPPVPDDQNFFKAPGISETNWVGRGSRELNDRLNVLWQGRTNSLVVAELMIVSSREASQGESAETIFRLHDEAARTYAEQFIRGVIGPTLPGTFGFYPIAARPLDQIKPAAAQVLSDIIPNAAEIEAELFPMTIDGSHVKIKPSGTNSFRVLLDPSVSVAGDFLRLSDPFEAEFDVIREALKRPYARLPGDYTYPPAIPIPNFITLRAVAQVLAERTKANLLLGQPEPALRDLTLMRDLCRITEAGPTGKPMTLVAAMINVAITGLYADTIADGLRLHAWREPQLVVIQEQLKRVNLAPLVEESFRDERIHSVHNLEHMPRLEIVKLFIEENTSLRQRATDSRQLFVMLAPRGWYYQNMVAHSQMAELALATSDSANKRFFPDKAWTAAQRIASSKKSPYNFFQTMFLPNFIRAWQIVAHNQTLANETLVACALERHRLAHNEYPETLAALSPRLIEKIPHDVIGAQPLHYRRGADGKFSLYSVGWNQKDDGGTTARNSAGKEDLENGDWVWGVVAK